MIYSLDAPTLENAFHKEFSDRRVNAVNLRKEFFRVTLDEIKTFALAHQAGIEFTQLAEAREYRETIAARSNAIEVSNFSTTESCYPETLLHT